MQDGTPRQNCRGMKEDRKGQYETAVLFPARREQAADSGIDLNSGTKRHAVEKMILERLKPVGRVLFLVNDSPRLETDLAVSRFGTNIPGCHIGFDILIRKVNAQKGDQRLSLSPGVNARARSSTGSIRFMLFLPPSHRAPKSPRCRSSPPARLLRKRSLPRRPTRWDRCMKKNDPSLVQTERANAYPQPRLLLWRTVQNLPICRRMRATARCRYRPSSRTGTIS